MNTDGHRLRKENRCESVPLGGEITMRMIAAHRGEIQVLNSAEIVVGKDAGFTTTLDALDDVAGPKAFARGAVHEILCQRGQSPPMFFAMVLARAASGDRAIVWSDPQ